MEEPESDLDELESLEEEEEEDLDLEKGESMSKRKEGWKMVPSWPLPTSRRPMSSLVGTLHSYSNDIEMTSEPMSISISSILRPNA